jgi:hypothetical protein
MHYDTNSLSAPFPIHSRQLNSITSGGDCKVWQEIVYPFMPTFSLTTAFSLVFAGSHRRLDNRWL